MAVTIPNTTSTASSTTTTAGAVAVTRYGLSIPGYGGATDNAAFWAPDAALNASSVTVVIAAHGAGGSNTWTDATTGPQGLMRQYFLDAGYCVLALNMHGDTFGNQTAQNDFAAAWRWLKTIVGWDVANLVLWGESMGGGAITAAFARASVPRDRVACAVLMAPLLNYTYLPAGADPTMVAAVNAAYNATDDASRSANSIDYDPMRRPVGDYAGLRVWISSSTQDTTVIRDQNALAFLSKIAGTAVSGTDYPTTGGHVSSQHYPHSTVTAFVASALTDETAQADNVPYTPGPQGGASAGYTPASIPGLLRWSRADDYAAIGDGAQFTSGSVVDRANAATTWVPGTAGSGPTYRASTAALGGQPSLEFDGTVADALAEGGTTTTLPSTGYTVWAVASRASTGGGTAPVLVGQDQITTNRVMMLGYSTVTPLQGRMVVFTNSTATNRIDPGTTLGTKTAPVLFMGTADTSATEQWTNGASAGPTTTPTGLYTRAGQRLTVGSAESTNTSYPFAGNLAEWGVYDHVLTATERAQLNSYVQDRNYGITVPDYISTGVAQTALASDGAPALDSATAVFSTGQTGTDTAGAVDSATVVWARDVAATDTAAAADTGSSSLTGAGAVALVGTPTSGTSGTTAVTSMSVAGPSAPATFAVMIVGRAGGLSTGALSGVSDTAGNTWRVATRGAVSGVTSTRVEVWYCDSYTPAATVTATSSASQTSGWLIAGFTGVVSATSLDVTSPDNSAAAAGGTITTPTITTTGSDLLIAADQHGGGTTGSGPAAPWTTLGGWDLSTTGGGNAGFLVAGAGSYSATFTQGGTGQAGVAIAGFRASAAGSSLTATGSDTAGATDSVTTQRSAAATGIDTAAAVDSATTAAVLAQSGTDTAGAVDSATAAFSGVGAQTGTDAAAAVDSATVAWVVTATGADVAAAADSATVAFAEVRSGADVAGAVDNYTSAATLSRSDTDTAGAVDSATVVATVNQAGTDTAGAVDSATTTLTVAGQYTDVAAAVDSYTAAATQARAGSDAAAATDSATTALAAQTAAVDTAAAADSATVAWVRSETNTDTAGATDVSSAVFTVAGQYTDVAGALDAVVTAFTALRIGTDAAAALDSEGETWARGQVQTDAAAAVDSATVDRSTAAQTVGIDTAAAADSATVVAALGRAGIDVAGATDSVTVVWARSVAATDVAGAADIASTAALLVLVVTDTAGAVDSAVGGVDVAALATYRWRLRYGAVGGRLRATTIGGTLRGRD